MPAISKTEMWFGIFIVLAMGVAHLAAAPAEFSETPYSYVGSMFIIHTLLAIVSAIGIYRDVKVWGWWLGLLIAAGAIVGYVISRTIGLPGMEVEDWVQLLADHGRDWRGCPKRNGQPLYGYPRITRSIAT